MGKRYYCDYCKCSFADGANNKKKHLASVQHQLLRSAHYDMFKSASDKLEEDKLKQPCRVFHQRGHCAFGTLCKYSHLTAKDVQELLEQAQKEKQEMIYKAPEAEPNIDSWLKTKKLKIEKHASTDIPSFKPILPPILSNIPNLPPSLIPCNPSELVNILKNADQEWG